MADAAAHNKTQTTVRKQFHNEDLTLVLQAARRARADAASMAEALMNDFPLAGPTLSPERAISPSPPTLNGKDEGAIICASESPPVEKKHKHPKSKRKTSARADAMLNAGVEPTVHSRKPSNSVFDRLSHPTSYPKSYVYKHIIKDNERKRSGGKSNGSMSYFAKERAARGHPFLDPDIAGAAATPLIAVRKQKPAQPKTPQSKRREHPPPKKAPVPHAAAVPAPRVVYGGGAPNIKKAKKKPKQRTAVDDTPPAKKKRRPHPFLDSDSPYKDQSPHVIRRGKAPRTTSHTAAGSTFKRKTALKSILQAIDNESPGRLDASDTLEKTVADLLTKNPKWVENDAGSAERDATVVTAMSSGKVGAAIFLLDHGAQVTAVRKSDGRGLLHLLLEHEIVNVTVLDAVVESGVPINSTDYSGMTALHVACSRRSTDANEILCILLEHNPEMVEDANGKTPGGYAADHPEMMASLLDRRTCPVSSPSHTQSTAVLPSSDTNLPRSAAAAAAATPPAASPAAGSGSSHGGGDGSGAAVLATPAASNPITPAAKVTLSPEMVALQREIKSKLGQAGSLDLTRSSEKRLADLLRNQAKELQTLVDLETHGGSEATARAPLESASVAKKTQSVVGASVLARQKRQAKRESLVGSTAGNIKRRSSSLSERSAVAYSPRDAQLDHDAPSLETAEDVFAMKPTPDHDDYFDDTAKVDQQRQNLKERLTNQRLQREIEKMAADNEPQRQQESTVTTAATSGSAKLELQQEADTAACTAEAEVGMLRKQLEAANAEASRAREMRENFEQGKVVVEKIKADAIVAEQERRKRAEIEQTARAIIIATANAERARVTAAEEGRNAAKKEAMNLQARLAAAKATQPEDAPPPPPPPPLDVSPHPSPEPVRSQLSVVAQAKAKRDALRVRGSLSSSTLNAASAAGSSGGCEREKSGQDFYSDDSGSEGGGAVLEAPAQRQKETLDRAKLRARVGRVQQVDDDGGDGPDFYSDSDIDEEESFLDAEKQRAREAALLRVKNRRAAAFK